MRRGLSTAGVAVMLLIGGGADASEQTVTLTLDGLWCASCAHIVKHTLAGVPGVSRVEVSFRTKTAVVTFDDGETDPAALTAVTEGVGFPSRVVEESG